MTCFPRFPREAYSKLIDKYDSLIPDNWMFKNAIDDIGKMKELYLNGASRDPGRIGICINLIPYRLFALDQDCKERMDRAYAADPYYLPSEMILPTSIQGFVLCNAGDKTPVIGFYGFPFSRKRIWRMEGILRITRALPFSRGVLTAEAFSRFIGKVMELGSRAAARQVEIELYRDIRSGSFSLPQIVQSIHTTTPNGRIF